MSTSLPRWAGSWRRDPAHCSSCQKDRTSWSPLKRNFPQAFISSHLNLLLTQRQQPLVTETRDRDPGPDDASCPADFGLIVAYAPADAAAAWLNQADGICRR